MNKLIKIYSKFQYGNNRIYIATEHKEAVSILTGKPTINDSDIKALKMLGFTFEEIPVPKKK